MITELFIASLIMFSGAQQAGETDYTTVGDVTIIAAPINPLLVVTVTGDLQMESLVRSDPIGVRCGAYEHRWGAYGRPRLCWTRRPVGTEIVLTASDGDRAGEWRVEWRGCEAFDDDRRCRLTLTGDTEVEVVFTRPAG